MTGEPFPEWIRVGCQLLSRERHTAMSLLLARGSLRCVYRVCDQKPRAASLAPLYNGKGWSHCTSSTQHAGRSAVLFGSKAVRHRRKARWIPPLT